MKYYLLYDKITKLGHTPYTNEIEKKRKRLYHNSVQDVFWIMRKYGISKGFVTNSNGEKLARVKMENEIIRVNGIVYPTTESILYWHDYRTDKTYQFQYVNSKFTRIQTQKYLVHEHHGQGRAGKGKDYVHTETMVMDY